MALLRLSVSGFFLLALASCADPSNGPTDASPYEEAILEAGWTLASEQELPQEWPVEASLLLSEIELHLTTGPPGSTNRGIPGVKLATHLLEDGAQAGEYLPSLPVEWSVPVLVGPGVQATVLLQTPAKPAAVTVDLTRYLTTGNMPGENPEHLPDFGQPPDAPNERTTHLCNTTRTSDDPCTPVQPGHNASDWAVSFMPEAPPGEYFLLVTAYWVRSVFPSEGGSPSTMLAKGSWAFPVVLG